MALGLGLLGGSWWAVTQPELQRADVWLGDLLRRGGSPAVDRLVVATTDLGSVYAVMGAAAVLAASGREETALDVLGVGTLGWVVAQQNKVLVGRRRPYEEEGTRRLLRPPTGSSFPSGHAAVAGGVSGVLADQARGPRSATLLRLVGTYVALSRVAAGVHYPTDVVGGAGLGLVLSGLWRGPVARFGRRLLRLAWRAGTGGDDTHHPRLPRPPRPSRPPRPFRLRTGVPRARLPHRRRSRAALR